MLSFEVFMAAMIGGAGTLAGQQIYRRVFGTSYRTQKQCNECAVRMNMEVIKRLVVELAIKAGVPPHEVARVVSTMGCDSERA